MKLKILRRHDGPSTVISQTGIGVGTATTITGDIQPGVFEQIEINVDFDRVMSLPAKPFNKITHGWPSQIYKEYTYLDSDGYMRIGNRQGNHE